MTPEITISRGIPRACLCCDDVHDVNVAINRGRWICAPCSKAIWRVGAVILKRDSAVAEFQHAPCNPPDFDVASDDGIGGGT